MELNYVISKFNLALSNLRSLISPILRPDNVSISSIGTFLTTLKSYFHLPRH